jgi:hypothetical protein
LSKNFPTIAPFRGCLGGSQRTPSLLDPLLEGEEARWCPDSRPDRLRIDSQPQVIGPLVVTALS